MSKHSTKKLSFTAGVAIAVGVSFVFALLLCTALALIASAGEDPTHGLTVYGETALCISMLICGFAGAKLGADKKAAGGFAAVGVMLLIIIAVSLAFGGSGFIKGAVLTALSAFCGSLGTFIGAREPKRRRRK